MADASSGAWAALDFLDAFLADAEADQVGSPSSYERRFPGAEAQVAAAFAGLESAAPREKERLGSYRILDTLGQGGQGTVYRAVDERLGREVALKVLPAPFGQASTAHLRFRREAEIASRLDHPGISVVYDAGVESGRAWIAMRLVEGEPLSRRMGSADATIGELAGDDVRAGEPSRTSLDASARSRKERWQDLVIFLRIVEGMGRALDVAHEAGVVHRDVKPANVMITPAGAPVVLDFGIAGLTEGDETTPVTQVGDVLGTRAYMSPEQTRGDAVDRRSDVWSLGVTLYEGVAGRRPFQGETWAELSRAIRLEEPADPRRLNPMAPSELCVVIATALAKEPARRYQTAAAFADDLARVAAREPVLARPASPWLRARRWVQRNLAFSVAMAAISCALLVLWLATWRARLEVEAGEVAKREALGTLRRTVASLLVEEARTTEALGQARTALSRARGLADEERVRALEQEDAGLWPPVPEKVAAMASWIARARELLSRMAEHRAATELVRTVAMPTLPELDPEVTRAWWTATLERLVGKEQDLAASVAGMERRLAFAQTVDERTIDDHADAWARLQEQLVAEPRYRGLELTPQRGLVPLGRDPESSLFEFAHLQSGVPPVRHPESGKLQITAASSLVFVLIPAGEVLLGTPADHPGWRREYSATGRPSVSEKYPRRLLLDAFFVSKFEMTEAQWVRATGENPMERVRGEWKKSEVVGPLRPVRFMTWVEAEQVLRRLDLGFPTEAQWARAAKGGTRTLWWTGDDPRSIAGAANLADATAAKTLQLPKGPIFDAWHDDGFAWTAPIGRFRANPFGLHDVTGNVSEWCRDPLSPYASDFDFRPGDGFQLQGARHTRTYRGGDFATPAHMARIGARAYRAPNMPGLRTGVRPMRPVR